MNSRRYDTKRVVQEDWNKAAFYVRDETGKVTEWPLYGGSLKGIEEKLDYLKSLGVTGIYLNPVFRSASNHHYDTADYMQIDPSLGTNEDFAHLAAEARERGIHIILDGVFSHTGADSIYFDRFGTYNDAEGNGEKGAYHNEDSPYRSWYKFDENEACGYSSWWGVEDLPEVDENNEDYREFILGKDGVIDHWMKMGASGWRLDVADELPDSFIAETRKTIKAADPDGLLIGEVWEDASNKIAYNIRRRYFVDGVLDSVMNYPFRTAILNYVKGWDDGHQLKDAVMTIAENYPPQVFACNMNLLGTHDTPRILTALVDDFDGSREELANRRLTDGQYALAQERLLMATCLQYTLPGSVSVYYGDEAGMEGFKDPFNRRTYPWGHENPTLIAHHRRLGQLRSQYPCLRTGNIEFSQAGEGKLRYSRTLDGHRVTVWFNRSGESWDVPSNKLLYGHNLRTAAPSWITLLPMGFCITED
jgi:4-alpha-glucanotransferase